MCQCCLIRNCPDHYSILLADVDGLPSAVRVVDWLIVRVFDHKLIVRVFDHKLIVRVFDHNNDGSISKEELREAMVNFGTRCTEE